MLFEKCERFRLARLLSPSLGFAEGFVSGGSSRQQVAATFFETAVLRTTGFDSRRDSASDRMESAE
jgi:hypothetical protein